MKSGAPRDIAASRPQVRRTHARTREVTPEQLAAAIAKPVYYVVRLLEEMHADGLVEETDGEWRLTAEADWKHGRALRYLESLL